MHYMIIVAMGTSITTFVGAVDLGLGWYCASCFLTGMSIIVFVKSH